MTCIAAGSSLHARGQFPRGSTAAAACIQPALLLGRQHSHPLLALRSSHQIESPTQVRCTGPMRVLVAAHPNLATEAGRAPRPAKPPQTPNKRRAAARRAATPASCAAAAAALSHAARSSAFWTPARHMATMRKRGVAAKASSTAVA